jgi:YhcH/YjgK/YiaL family protein
MIIDTLANAEKYYGLHKSFKAAFEYLNSQNLAAIEDGKFDIADGLKAIMANNDGKTAAVAAEKFECHNKNIDIQVCVHGNETIGWKPRGDCKSPKGEYNEEKDVTFFNDAPDMHFALKDGQFVVFFPEDVHAPMIGEGPIKKLVLKVKI